MKKEASIWTEVTYSKAEQDLLNRMTGAEQEETWDHVMEMILDADIDDLTIFNEVLNMSGLCF